MKRAPALFANDQDMDVIAEYLEHLRRAGRTDQTINERRKILSRLNRLLEYGITQTSTDELAGWLYDDQWSQNTRYTYYTAAKSFYGWATTTRDPWLSFDPTEDLERVAATKGVARPVTSEQLRRILAEAAEPVRTWATIAAYAGLRCIEISRLDREHVTQEHLIVVRGKGNKAGCATRTRTCGPQ